MLQVVTKAKSREAALLARQRAALRLAFDRYLVLATQSPDIKLALARQDIEGVLRGIDRAAAVFGAGWIASFVDVGNLTTAQLSRKLVRKARPTLGLSFDQTDPIAVDLMQRNRLALVTGLSRQQRNVIRPILVRGIQQGLGPVAVARQLKSVVGLHDQGARDVAAYRATLEGLQSNAERALSVGQDTGIDALDPAQIDRMVSNKADQLQRARALAIARTEATRITSIAQQEGLRQSLESIGHSRQLVGHQWNTTHDGREREAHSAADGQRRRLDESFEVGGEQIRAPGQGSARNSVNCRCVETFEIFDTPAELEAWRAGSS